MQIELGITATADNFGSGSISKFKAKYPNGIIQQEYPSSIENNVYGIIQCALWTKGYSTEANSITKHFYDGTGNGIKLLKQDMGFKNPTSIVTVDFMKALLSMNQYVLISTGTSKIRQIQQELNREYPTYLGIIPCDGTYTRSMNKALITVLQAIEGYDEDGATGNFGSGTKSKLPLALDELSIQNVDKYHKCIKLIQYSLCCNGYADSIDLSNINWNTSLSNTLSQFQQDMNLNKTGSMNVDTWMALLLSKGNPDRSCNACDTNRPVTLNSQFSYLRNNGISIIGRYLSNSTKGLKREEAITLIDEGFSIFPIFQEIGIEENITAFTSNRGNQDAVSAISYGKAVGLFKGTTIYFAVDFDTTDYEITNYVLPYFESLNNKLGGYYNVGVYGTRNVCTRVVNNSALKVQSLFCGLKVLSS